MNKTMPKLRFGEFTDEWQVKKLGNISSKIGSGSTPRGGSNVYKSSGIPFVRSQNITGGRLVLDDVVYIDQSTHKSMQNSKISPNDVLLNITGASLGRSCVVPSDFQEGNLNQHVCIIRLKNDDSPYLVHTLLSTPKGLHELLKTQTGGGKEGLNFQAVRAFKVSLPSKPEQQKIAGFLTVVDERVELMQKRVDLLQKYKKGMMQKIFTQKIRFKDDDGNNFPEWQEKSLSEISDRVTQKNKDNAINFVLTNSATKGIVSQIDYFEKNIANKNNLTNYYVVSIDDFIYNPRISVHAPVGPIKRNHLKIGVMSPLYSVFRINKGNKDFYEYYFGTDYWHDYLRSVANSGARHDRMNITTTDLYDMPLPYPCKEEQQKIANFLTSLDDKIKVEEDKLTQAKLFKKSLLQRMFV